MAIRKIIKIDEEKCTGCGLCIPACAEGALQIVDGKARLVKEQYCDGLGDCIGECPEGAITIEERETEPFDEEAVKEYLNSSAPGADTEGQIMCCPAATLDPDKRTGANDVEISLENIPSELTHWPVHLKLVPSEAPFFKGSDLLICAVCVPFAYAGLHPKLLKGHAVVTGCPKLDDAEQYIKKLTEIISENELRSITVAYMEVSCCAGLTHIVRRALTRSGEDVPVQEIVVGANGTIIKEVVIEADEDIA